MDIFGIGAAMRCMVDVYCRSARKTGRTTSLLERLKDGDMVCCATQPDALSLEKKCLERGLKVSFLVRAPRDSWRLPEARRPTGRFFFEHAWIEQFYIHALGQCEHEIDHWQDRLSGDKSDLKPTERERFELEKWRS